MNTHLANKTLDYVKVSSATVRRALDEINVHRAGTEKAASLREPTLKLLLDANCIDKSQKEAAEAMLGSHAETHSLLKNAAQKIAQLQSAQKAAGDLGRGVDSKTAGLSSGGEEYDSLTDGYVGKKTSLKKASDQAILAVLDAPG